MRIRYKSSVPTDPDGLVTDFRVGVCAIELAFGNTRQLYFSKGGTACKI